MGISGFWEFDHVSLCWEFWLSRQNATSEDRIREVVIVVGFP